MRMLLNLKNIYKNYGKEPLIVPVLIDVSLEVEQGDYVAIMGPSGSGKTTLMNIIGCLDRASTGTYLFEDEDISEMNDDALSDLRLNKIGFVVVLRAKCKNVANKMQKIGFKKRHFKRLLNAK